MGTSLAFLTLGLINSKTNLVQENSWLQTLCLVFHLLIFNSGYGSLCYPLVAELLPSESRTKGLSFLMVISGLFGFLNSLSFDQLAKFMETNHIYFTYGLINSLGFLYLYVFLPKTLIESQIKE